MKPIEQHLADFLLENPGDEFREYRRRCLLLWRDKYGETVARRAHKLAAEKGGRRSASQSQARQSGKVAPSSPDAAPS